MGIALNLVQSMRKDGIFLRVTADENLVYEAQRALKVEEIELLKQYKTEIVALLKATDLPQKLDIKPRCSVSQENLYLLCQSASVNVSYNLCFSLRFEQTPDSKRLALSLANIQLQQPSLRSGFQLDEGRTVLHRSDTSEIFMEELSLDEEHYNAWLNEVSQTEFNLSRPPLWRFWLVDTGQCCRLVVLVHHIVWDGWSSARFREMLDHAYGQNLGPVDITENSGADQFAHYQREAHERGDWRQSLEYWQNLLAYAPKQNDWLSHTGSIDSKACHATYEISLSEVAQTERFSTLLSAWFLAFSRQYRCNRMVFGVAVANRDLNTELENSLGYFNNVVPVTQHHLLTTPAKEVLANVQAQWRESVRHQNVPFGHIVNTVMPNRTIHSNPLTQVVIGYQSFDWEAEYEALPHKLETVKNTHAKLPLSIQMSTLNGQLVIEFEYDPCWYDEAQVDALFTQLKVALKELSSLSDPSLTQAWITGTCLPPSDGLPINLVDMLKKTADKYPNKILTFIESDGDRCTLSYEELYHQSLQMAGRLQQGKPWSYAGHPVIVIADDLVQYLVNFWAVLLAGGQPVTINVPQVTTQDGLTKIVDAYKQLNGTAIICCSSGKQALLGLSHIGIDDHVISPSEYAESSYLEYEINPVSPGIIQLSSGSTGKSKCIQQNHKTIINYCDLITQSRSQKTEDISLNWMGFDHVGGLLFTHLRDTYLGCAQVHVSTSFILQSPLRWLELIEAFRVTHSWCPNFAYKLMISEAASCKQIYDLSSLKELINGGEMVVADTVRQFIETFSPWGLASHVLTPAFGMAESCTVISTHPVAVGETVSLNSYAIDSQDEYTQIGHSEFVCLGKAVANTEIRIVSDDNEVLNEYEVGKMQLRGPSITMGYLGAPELNKKAFIGDGWFDTGDCGVIVGGKLYLTGRMQESIVLNGINFFNHDIEAVVGSIQAVDETCTAAVGYQAEGDAAVVFYVADSSMPVQELDDCIRRRLAEALQFYPTQLVRLARNDFLKTTAGKIQRRRMVERWLNESALNDNPIMMARVLSAPFPDVNSVPVSHNSLSDFVSGTLDSRTPAVVVSNSEMSELLSYTDELKAKLCQTSVQQLVLISELANGPELERWAQAYEASVPSVSIKIVTCESPAMINRVPIGGQSKRLHFDGITGFEEREIATQWQNNHAPASFKTSSYSVVTGASGGIAQHLIEALIEAGEFVVLFSRSKPKITESLTAKQCCWIPVDFISQDTLTTLWEKARFVQPLLEHPPQRVYHLSGQFHRDSLNDLTQCTLSRVKAVNEGALNQLVDLLNDSYDYRTIEWFVFGSINALRGGHQSLSYNMSQAATRSVVTQLRLKGCHASWLGWSAWENTGMSVGEVDLSNLRNIGLQVLRPKDCLQVIPSILSLPAGDYLIGTQPLSSCDSTVSQEVPKGDEVLQTNDLAPLRAIWQKLLGCDSVPDQQSFFELGGSSILLYKLQHHIQHDLGYHKVTMADLFSAPTLQSMSLMLSRFSASNANSQSHQELKQDSKKNRHTTVKQRFKRRMNK
ncbi:condensation domain-containing protein [Vibrio caribbeanicus]|uniref:condensation domain-containing protein n=1 Tax=Vibrio caribbeanicus TaxID=701175 RepID=UPI0030DC530A